LHKCYRGGPVVITLDIFHQAKIDRLPKGMSITLTACEGSSVERNFSLAHWLEKNDKKNAFTIFLSTPTKAIAEAARNHFE
jgi:sulfide:quinone oxidoreductase